MPRSPNLLGDPTKEAQNDPVLRALQPFLHDREALGRWVRSMRSTLGSASFRAMLAACGNDLQAAKDWLDASAKLFPAEAKSIERLNVMRPGENGKPRKTSVSLDPELWATLVAREGSGDKAYKWLRETAATTSPGAGSFSRAMQAAIVRHVSSPAQQQQPAEPHADAPASTPRPAAPGAP